MNGLQKYKKKNFSQWLFEIIHMGDDHVTVFSLLGDVIHQQAENKQMLEWGLSSVNYLKKSPWKIFFFIFLQSIHQVDMKNVVK